MQICHRHKGTAVHGLTFLFVTSKHTVHPWWHGTSLISLHLFPTLHWIPHWTWMFFISTHPGCLHRWRKHHFSCEDLDLSADSAADSAVADKLISGHLPMCHYAAAAAAAGICDAAFIPELQLFAISHPDGWGAKRHHHPELENRRLDSRLRLPLCHAVTQKSGPNGTQGVHEEAKCHEIVKEHSRNYSLVFSE